MCYKGIILSQKVSYKLKKDKGLCGSDYLQEDIHWKLCKQLTMQEFRGSGESS